MRLLYIGDIMGEPGIKAVAKFLPKIRAAHKPDLIIAQAENVSGGKGVTPEDFRRLQKLGIDFCTGGNWTLHNKSIIRLLEDKNEPIIRPANYPKSTPGLGYKYFNGVLIISLLGSIVGKDADQPIDNPLQVVDTVLAKEGADYKTAIVNFHGDYSSEKVIIGHYLDGRVALVVGDHWHVPTADARVLPKGTAHITDVGMCGALDSSLGVKLESVISRWRDGHHTKNQLETKGPLQFNAVLVETNEQGLAKSIQQIQHVF